jgi:protocatechuate 3,4-dioxygenase beta subunit
LRVDGRIVDAASRQPVASAHLRLYHTDERGVYGDLGSEQPRLEGSLVTGVDGTFQVRTIVPASYPDTKVTRHVHYSIEAEGYERVVSEFLFDDDPLLTADRRRAAEADGWPILEVEEDAAEGEGAVRGRLVLTLVPARS